MKSIFHHPDLKEILHSDALGDHPNRSERITQSRFQSVTKNDHFLELHPNGILDFLRQIILENESTIQESVHHIVN